LFLGHHFTQLKNSNRLPIRSDWKKLISSGVYLTQGFDQNILIMTPNTFQEIYARLAALNITDPLVRLLLRMFLGTANYIENVENETISLPQDLLGYANLESNVVVVGQGEYVEVWSSDLWQQQQAEMQDSQANAQRFSSLTISIA
jgi:MraZ protein